MVYQLFSREEKITLEHVQSRSSLPLYVQISEVMIREIAAGQLIDGARLPPERDLAKHYGTTVRTLRKALKILENKELLRRVQGSGNYIQSSGDMDSVYSMFRLELVSGGGLPTARLLDLKSMAKADDLPSFGQSKYATRIRRVRCLNHIPIALEEIWLDQDAGEIMPEKLTDSVYLYYKQQLGFWIDYAEDFVSVSEVPDWSPAEFAPPIGSIVGLVERFSFAGEMGSVEFSRNWFDPYKARYVQRLK